MVVIFGITGAGPMVPVAPVGPVAPVDPVEPVAPVEPIGPVAPETVLVITVDNFVNIWILLVFYLLIL
jgi:hypothetical protein